MVNLHWLEIRDTLENLVHNNDRILPINNFTILYRIYKETRPEQYRISKFPRESK